MAFSLAEIFVTIGADTNPFKAGLDSVKKSIGGVKSQLEGFSSAARKVFLGLAGAGAYVVKQQADQEAADSHLRSSLKNTGQEVDRNFKKLTDLAGAIQNVTTYSDDGAQQLMSLAINMGATADQAGELTKLGIGLAEAFGGDAAGAVEAVTKAMNGNFRELERQIPAVKEASTASEKWAAIQRVGTAGFNEAQDHAKTFSGGLKQLWNDVSNLGEEFGKILLPALKNVTLYIRTLAQHIQNLTPAQKDQIVHWGLIAAGVAAVIGFGPAVIGFGSAVVSAFTAIAGAAISIGTAIIAGIFTPFGLIVIGVAAAVTAFAYFAGAGEGAVGKIIDGFKRLWDFISFVFNNSGSLSEAMAVAWGGIGFIISDAWTNAKAAMISIWATIKTAFRAFWEDLQHSVTSAVISMTNFFVNAWDSALSAHRAAVKATGDFFEDTWISTKEKLGMITQQQADEQRKYLAHMRDQESAADAQADADKKAAKEKFFADMHKLEEDQHKQNVGGVGQDEQTEKAKAEADRKAKIAENAKGFQAFKDQQAAAFKASGNESLSKQIEDLYAKAKAGLGVDDLLKMVDTLKGEAQKIKDQAQLGVEQLQGKEGKGKKDKDAKENKTSDVASAFKDDLARSIAGADKLRKETAAEKATAAAAKKAAELHAKQLAEAIRHNKVVEDFMQQTYSLSF